jgi:hypothetical protein
MQISNSRSGRSGMGSSCECDGYLAKLLWLSMLLCCEVSMSWFCERQGDCADKELHCPTSRHEHLLYLLDISKAVKVSYEVLFQVAIELTVQWHSRRPLEHYWHTLRGGVLAMASHVNAKITNIEVMKKQYFQCAHIHGLS